MLEATGVVGIGSINQARTLSATTVDWQNHKLDLIGLLETLKNTTESH